MAIYNNPHLGKSFENIASMFAPPGASDLAGYALARERNQKADIIAQLQSDPRYQGADAGVLADLFDPTNSWAAQDQNTATVRRGQDVTANTSITNNRADNQRQFVTEMFGPVSQDALRPEVPASIGGLFGVDQSLPAVQGNRSPLSETEVAGSELLRLIGEGDITDQMQVENYVGGNTPVKVVGPDGNPTFATPGGAIGQQAYVDVGSQPKPENAVAKLRDGTTVPAVQQPDGRWVHAQSGAALPSDIQIFKLPQAQGTAADVGLSKPTDTYIEKQLIDIATAKDTAVKLRDMIATAPASQGIVGWMRGTAQNIVQTGGELGQFFGGGVAQVAQDIEAGLADADLAGAFDPQIPAIEMMANLLAFQYAKTTTGERLSNEMLRASRAALGLEGLDANQANSIARLNQAISQIESQEALLNRVLQGGISAASSPAPGAPNAAAMAGVPPGWDPEDWKYLTPEEQAQVTSGQ